LPTTTVLRSEALLHLDWLLQKRTLSFFLQLLIEINLLLVEDLGWWVM